VDLHPVVSSQLSSRRVVLTTTLLIPPLVSECHYQLRADINQSLSGPAQIASYSIDSSEASVAETPTCRSCHYCEPAASIIRFNQFFIPRSGYAPRPRRNRNIIFWQEHLAVSLLSESCALSLCSAASIILLHSSLLCPGTLPWDDVAAIWHPHCFIFRPAASRLRLPKAAEDLALFLRWNTALLANRLHLIHRLDVVVWSLIQARPAPGSPACCLLCFGHRPASPTPPETRLFFHSLLRPPLSSAGLARIFRDRLTSYGNFCLIHTIQYRVFSRRQICHCHC